MDNRSWTSYLSDQERHWLSWGEPVVELARVPQLSPMQQTSLNEAKSFFCGGGVSPFVALLTLLVCVCVSLSESYSGLVMWDYMALGVS